MSKAKFDLSKLPENRQMVSALGNSVKSKGFVHIQHDNGQVFEEKQSVWDMFSQYATPQVGHMGMTIRLSF